MSGRSQWGSTPLPVRASRGEGGGRAAGYRSPGTNLPSNRHHEVHALFRPRSAALRDAAAPHFQRR